MNEKRKQTSHFYEQLAAVNGDQLVDQVASVNDRDVQHVLGKSALTAHDFLCLLSPAAEPHLERMARKAHDLTVAHFGRTIALYTPIYLSSHCTNSCIYCGFNRDNAIERRRLTLEEVEREGRAIAESGLKHLLVLTGDAPSRAGVDYIESCLKILRRFFPALGIEIFALPEEDYRRLIHAGVDSLTIYQETYNETLYEKLHPAGPKRDFRFRLDAPARACRAGMRAVNVGALLGLDDWRRDAFFTGLHAFFLQDNFPEAEISISLPRMRPHAGSYKPACIVEDRHIVQIMTAMRLYMPRLGINISTRERARFRDRILPLGVTRMSAASCTAVGGWTDTDKTTGQFDISDDRSVPDMEATLRRAGWQPVYKDWQALGQ